VCEKPEIKNGQKKFGWYKKLNSSNSFRSVWPHDQEIDAAIWSIYAHKVKAWAAVILSFSIS